jgi:uncharacterized membrane protein
MATMPIFRRSPSDAATVSDVSRIEFFSDAVMAISITLLVLEIKVPHLTDMSGPGVALALLGILPKLLSFTFSFLTIAVFWVNHHHFFHEVERSDWRLLWYNNFLLFWLSLVPFTTAFLGEHPFNPWVAMTYCFSLFMAALAFMLMIRHALFSGNLVHKHIPLTERVSHYKHSWTGVICYGLSTITAPIFPPVSIGLMIFIPLYYIAPRLMHDHDEAHGN